MAEKIISPLFSTVKLWISPFLMDSKKLPEMTLLLHSKDTTPSICDVGEFTCNNSVCVPGGRDGAICNGINDCGDMSDEINCGRNVSVSILTQNMKQPSRHIVKAMGQSNVSLNWKWATTCALSVIAMLGGMYTMWHVSLSDASWYCCTCMCVSVLSDFWMQNIIQLKVQKIFKREFALWKSNFFNQKTDFIWEKVTVSMKNFVLGFF